MVADSPPDFRLRLRRDSNAVIAWLRDMWTRRWFRWLGYLALSGVLGLFLPPSLVLGDLTDITLSWQPMAIFTQMGEETAYLPVFALVMQFIVAVVAICWAKVSYDKRLELR